MSMRTVESMRCAHCVRSVTEAVQTPDPAVRVDVDLAGKRVPVASRAPLARIAGAIAAAGDPVVSAD